MEAFLAAAAKDPHVFAIKMTQYRIGANSPLIDLLSEAAEAGKQVAVLVELTSRSSATMRQMPPAPSPINAALLEAARATPDLDLLLLFGSRARGDAHAASDWDFGYITAREIDAPGLLARIVEAVGSDRVDLVDLCASGGLLRYRAARDGLTVFEAEPGRAERFRLDAARFWCDAEPVLKRGYEAVLAELKP